MTLKSVLSFSFSLGDVFDEGLWVSKEDFEEYMRRFHSIFQVSKTTKVFVVPGNHDMGFHYVYVLF